MKLSQLCLLALIPFALLNAGCGTGNPSVSGNVKFEDGSPLTVGIITFDSGTYSSHADIGADGSFTIEGGLPADSYKITLGGDAMGSYDDPTPMVQKSYGNYDTTDLEQEVKSSGNEIEVVVKKP